MITISINGEITQVNPQSTVQDLVINLQLDIRKIAVEKNLIIVPKSLYNTTHLNDKDTIEIIRFVGGG